jgi:hypothetical protein
MIRRLLRNRARVTRGTPTWVSGVVVDQPVLLHEALPCRLTDVQQGLSGRRTDQQGQLVADLFRTLYAEADADVKPGDQVEVLGQRHVVESTSLQADGAYLKALLVAEETRA